jgi:hypothetical protein
VGPSTKPSSEKSEEVGVVVVGDTGCIPALEDRTWVSSWVVNAVMETLEGMDVMESKRESRRGKPGVERADTEELRT